MKDPMSIWSRILDAIAALRAGEGLLSVLERLTAPRDQGVGFTIAVIALGAKMAKADGVVTRDEVRVFRQVFHIAPEDEAAAARVFNLARQDVAGYQVYARQVAKVFRTDTATLEDLLEGLFSIALANGEYHPKEEEFLTQVANIFGVSDHRFHAIRARFVKDASPDPYAVLGVDPSASYADIRAAWRKAVRENHPDQMMARGIPEEAIRLAQNRLVGINQAWEHITEGRGL